MNSPTGPLVALLTLILVGATVLLGAQIRVAYLVDVVRHPRGLVLGLTGQLVLLPLLATAFLLLIPEPFNVGLGWFLLAAAPGGVMSNMVTFLGHGRLSLSMVLTACSTLAGMVTIPLWVSLGLALSGGDGAQGLTLTTMLFGSFLILVVPLSIGIAIGTTKPKLADRAREPTRRAMLVLIALAIIGYTTQRWEYIARDFDAGYLVGAALFHATAVLCAWAMGRLGGLDPRDAFTVAIEVGIQNVVVALLLVELLARPDLIAFVGYYALTMLALLVAWLPLLGPTSRPASLGPRPS